MKLYELIVKPRAGFGTPLKGDTLFGHFCWQAQYDPELLNGGLDKWVDSYAEKPFAVFSSAWPKLSLGGKMYYAMKRPDLPLAYLFPPAGGDRKKMMMEIKEKARQKWLLLEEDLQIDIKKARYVSESDIAVLAFGELTDETRRIMRGKAKKGLTVDFIQSHNTIDRSTQTTGRGMFAPYAVPSVHFYPEMELAVFILIDEEATDIARIRTAMERIGRQGFGRDASTGLGRFDLGEDEEKKMPDPSDADACYTLAPSVPEGDAFREHYFAPFTRFGRHGDILATSASPFKNPVIMADEGAVFIPAGRSVFEKPYLGKGMGGLSKSDPRTVAQGYAPYLPFKLEMEK